MLYKLSTESIAEDTAHATGGGPRFVLHRHCDENGPHLDLRLEQDGHLMGFRVDGATLGAEAWATLKAPHPRHWLDQDGDAVRQDGGTYFWESREGTGGALILRGSRDTLRVRVEPVGGLNAGELGAVRAAAEKLGVALGDLPALAEDGAIARERAIARVCGLGRELDGDAFDNGLWQKTLAGERLGAIQQYLHTLEVRFDRKYPPQPVSRPDRLEDPEVTTGASTKAREILSGKH